MKVRGLNGISAEVVQDSISPDGKRVTSLNLKYGLIIHAEHLRHRLLSNSVASQRAIPMKKIRQQVLKEPYVPVWFGAQQKGMVADKEVGNKSIARQLWLTARYPACFAHWIAEKIGAHKEWSNRLLNPWQFVQQTVTATEWDNYFELRIHKDAQKDIQEISRCIKKALDKSEPVTLYPGEYHVPYVQRSRLCGDGVMQYFDNDGARLTVEQAIKASAARVARSSYNNHDKSDANFKTDEELYQMLIESNPKHLSPAEAQCTPMKICNVARYNRAEMDKAFGVSDNGNPKGVTHMDCKGRLWSGNLMGWCQHRQTLGGFTDENGVK